MTIVYSTFSSDAIRERVLAQYSIEDVADCVFFMRGLNDTYRVSAKDRRIAVRLYRSRWRSRDEINAEITALLHIEERGVPVAAPIPRTDGQWLTRVDAPEGQRWAVLFNWVGGEEPRYIDPTHASAYGNLAARLHAATDNLSSSTVRLPHDVDYLLYKPATSLRSALQSRPQLLPRFDALVDRLATRLESVRDQLGDWGFCHGDLHFGNARILGDCVALFDFDCCGPGWRVYDLATYRWAARIRGVAEQAWKPFIEAYLHSRPAASGLVKHVPLFVVLRHLWLHGYFAWNATEVGVGNQQGRGLDELVAFLERLENEATP